ncbi:DUF1501 domain-containing protein [Baekduia sp. Peel2402]|uniref:DUF1501 domain-containing protein n=1 Tax=Baekduia sp. Peel2402 TaxID=3458296 RepID=UPI00403ECA51
MACCDDFRRATAGHGLPAIEPGMPDPAGTGMDRRAFLMRGAGLALSVYGASKLGLDQLEAGVAAASSGSGAPVLVNVFLPGGLDSLSALAPVGDARYAALRPTLKLAAGTGATFAEDTRLMWHPAAAGLAQLHAEGKVSVFPAIGYDHPDQSHFTSRHFWEVGALDPGARLGWMGRYLDVVGDVDNPLQGIALDASLAPSLASSRVPVAAISKPSDYSFWVQGVANPTSDPMMEAYGRMGALAGGASGALDTARTVVRQVDGVRRSLGAFVTADGKPGYTSPVTYPSGDLGARLAALGAMLAAGLPIRCVAVQGAGGYDTHSDQATTLTTNLGKTVDSIVAFQRDLEARGLADRVLIQMWSEFGRRPKENGTGTDHGAAGCAFVIGTRAKGTMVGEFPGLSTLDAQSNLRATSDFRTMYCSLLEQWMGIDAAQVIPNAAALGRVALVR